MKNILSVLLLFALLASSCSEEELVKSPFSASDSLKFTASFECDESRTYVEKERLLRWTAGDRISLFVGYTLNRQYQFDGETGSNSGTFSVVDSPFGTGNKLNAHYAVYPYDSKIKISDDDEVAIQIKATLPAIQSYAENSFGLGANTMVAVTKDTNDTYLRFKNLCGYLKLQLYGDDVTVKSITLKGNAIEKIAGSAIITPSYAEAPTLSMASAATETITLDCGEGVKIGSTAEEATAFWIVVPPTSFGRGITIDVTDIEGNEYTHFTTKTVSVERNVITTMAAYDINCDKFVSLGMGTFQDNFALGGTYSVEIQKQQSSDRYRVIDPYKEGLTNDDGEWGNWIAMGSRCPYIEFWETGEGDLILFNNFALGINYQAVASQPIRAYHASSFSGTNPEFSKKVDDKTYQLAPYYYINGLGGWNNTEANGVIVITLP